MQSLGRPERVEDNIRSVGMAIDTAAFVTGNHIQYSEASEEAIKGGLSRIKLLLSDSVNYEALSSAHTLSYYPYVLQSAFCSRLRCH